MGRLLDALTSTECIAAFLGATAAFMLEALRRWRADRLARLAAGNEAVFVLGQMYTGATNINNQLFIDRHARVQAELKRDANYLEFQPMEIGMLDQLHIDGSSLVFLLHSHDPDILNRLAAVNRDYSVLLRILLQRNTAHWEFQQMTADLVANQGGYVGTAQLEQRIGLQRAARLRDLTSTLEEGLPRCVRNLHEVTRQLTNVLAMEFPTSRVAGFDVVERNDDVTAVPKTVKASWWRRAVRRAVREPLWGTTTTAPKPLPDHRVS